MKKIIFTELQESEILKMYNDGIGCVKIAKKFDLCSDTVLDFLRSKNIEIIGTKRKHCESSFFEKIDTEEKAYWLGFLYADGCVRIRNKKYYEVKIKLAEKDKEHVEKFKNAIKSTNVVRIANEKYKYLGKTKIMKSAWLGIYDKKMAMDLIDKGCIPNKSLKIEYPKWLNKDLTRHFIRGYFDGDGSVGKYKYNKHKCKYVYICSGSINFLKEVYSKLNFLKNMTWTVQRKTLFLINTYTTEDIKKIYEFFYKDSNVFLERKMAIMKSIINNTVL